MRNAAPWAISEADARRFLRPHRHRARPGRLRLEPHRVRARHGLERRVAGEALRDDLSLAIDQLDGRLQRLTHRLVEPRRIARIEIQAAARVAPVTEAR